MNIQNKKTHTVQKRQSNAKLMWISLLLPFSLAFLSVAHANELVNAGVIDTPVPAVSNTAASAKQLKDQVDEEQKELAKKDRTELEELANKGERLAIVALGSDFADEAQQILFAPEAANTAISDALALYSLAARRGYPGSVSLDSSGVQFHPVRVVRNR